MTPLSKPRIPDYEISAEIGRGGMRVVYHAVDSKHERRVAIKMMLSQEAAYAAIDTFSFNRELSSDCSTGPG